jgi:hypothetical protein
MTVCERSFFILTRTFDRLIQHDLVESRRRLFVDSPQQITSTAICEQAPTPVTPRKASGVIKQLFSSPSSSLKRTLPSPNQSSINTDKRPRLF